MWEELYLCIGDNEILQLGFAMKVLLKYSLMSHEHLYLFHWLCMQTPDQFAKRMWNSPLRWKTKWGRTKRVSWMFCHLAMSVRQKPWELNSGWIICRCRSEWMTTALQKWCGTVLVREFFSVQVSKIFSFKILKCF